MAQVKVTLRPGINVQATEALNEGGWSSSNLVRWKYPNLLEKMGGWQRLVEGAAKATVRAMHAYEDLSLNNNLILGTDDGPQILVDGTYYDMVLARASRELTPPWYAATAGFLIVNVTDVANGASVGDQVQIPMTVGGYPPGYLVKTIDVATVLGIAHGNGVTVAVGAGGAIRTSTDAGSSWTARTSGVATELRAVTWTGTQFVVVGLSGVILTSLTGTTWTPQTSGTAADLYGVAWSGSLLAAVGSAGTILTSPTGAVWTARSSGTAAILFAVTWGVSLFVAVGATGAVTISAAGTSWAVQASGTSDELRSVCASDTTFVATGATGTIITSPNGSAWAARTSGTSQGLFGSVWTGTQFVAVGAVVASWFPTSQPAILTSTTGTTWSFEPFYPNVLVSVANLLAACWDGSEVIAVGGGTAVAVSPTSVTGQFLRIDPGAYTITIVTNPNLYSFNNPTPAGVSSGLGGYPTYFVMNPFGQSTTVRCFLQNHGLTAGGTFTVGLATSFPVNGIELFGNYTVTAVLSTYAFDIDIAASPATGTRESVYENNGPAVINYLVGAPEIPRNWFIDNLGEDGLICPENGPIYVYQPPIPDNGIALGEVIAGSPLINTGMFVAMPQAQIVAFGSEATIGGGVQDPLLVRYSDVGSFTDWVASPTNQAGSFRLSRGSRIIGGIQAPQSTLLWTDVDLWSMTYVGGQFVYSFLVMGSGCGLIAPKARTVLGRNTYWIGEKCFWTFGDQGAVPLESPVWDYLFNDIDEDNISKAFAASNSAFGEVMFFFPSASGGTGEVDSYVKFQAQSGLWDTGRLKRSAWIDSSVFGPPLGADDSFRIQKHETGYDADDVPMSGVFAKTGFFQMGDGTQFPLIDQMIPDMKWFGDKGQCFLTLWTADYAAQEPTMHGPFSITPTNWQIPMRARGRYIAMRIDWAPITGFSARMGGPSVRMAPAGRR